MSIGRRLRRLRRWLASPGHRQRLREIRRLETLPRYRATRTGLPGKLTSIVDAASFLAAYEQILRREIYRFDADGEAPLIFDCGANIGLGILYWKSIYPRCRVIAFEPDPAVHAALVENVQRWRFGDTEIRREAVWKAPGHLPFDQEGADAGKLRGDIDSHAHDYLEVPTTRLRDHLIERIDLLKLDIEGAETEVLEDCADRLDQVENLFVEFHSFVGRSQRLSPLLHVLESAGFRHHIQPELVARQPFVDRPENAGMDQRLNVFAFRPR